MNHCSHLGEGSDRLTAFVLKVEGRMGYVLSPPAVPEPLSPPRSPPAVSPEALAAIQELV